MEYDNVAITIPQGKMTLEEIKVFTKTVGDFKKTITERYGPWLATIPGQQSMAEAASSIATLAEANAFIVDILEGPSPFPAAPHLIDYTVNTERRSGGEQRVPLEEDEINSRLADGGDPDNGFRTESVAETEVSTGDPNAQRRIEFSMPYASDDVFTAKLVSGSSPPSYTYTAETSDAQAKAITFGRVQNRMLLGNRSGMNIQVAPEVLPSDPFAPVFVEAAGTINLYRLNGTSWTMDASGIVASSDAMFWGTAGKKA
jgi:hypothetical protein